MTRKQELKLQSRVAAALGRIAFENGMKCVPVHDQALMVLLAGNAVGEGMGALTAWTTAWHVANLGA